MSGPFFPSRKEPLTARFTPQVIHNKVAGVVTLSWTRLKTGIYMQHVREYP